ncbi:MAG: hypothetical protein RL885_09355 [Planctomycetota bacterium]
MRRASLALTLGLLAAGLLTACDEAEYREKLTIRSDRSGTLVAQFRVSRLDQFIQLIAQQLGKDDIPLFDFSLLEKIPDGLKLDSFEDLSNDDQFHYRLVISFQDVSKLRQLDAVIPAAQGSRTTLFRELTWEQTGDGWMYRRQLGDGTMPERAADRRAAREMGFRFHFELHAPDTIDRANAKSIENDIARWTVSFGDVMDGGGSFVLSAEIAPAGSILWVLLPVALAGILIGATQLRGKRRKGKKPARAR